MTQRQLARLMASHERDMEDEYSGAPHWSGEKRYCPVCGAPLRDGDMLIFDGRSSVVLGCESCTYTCPA